MDIQKSELYQAAVQNPAVAFTDPELKSCSVELTPLGTPRPYAGNFAVTYKFQGAGQDYAVRCFHREVSRLRERYQALEQFMVSNSSRFFLDAKYMVQGIQMGQLSCPIVKMSWCKGETLNQYLARIHKNTVQVARLIQEFRVMAVELERLGIAHGDLQHGNIMVQEDRLLLVDYDGMYLPELVAGGASELGHINYQHPLRTEKDYNARIDRFSILIIYLGLLAVSVKPGLWSKYDNGENILFRSSDFLDPEDSKLLRELSAIPQLRTHVQRVKSCCRTAMDLLPTLAEFLSGNFSCPRMTALKKPGTARRQYLILDASDSRVLLSHYGEKVEIIGKIISISEGWSAKGGQYYLLNFTRCYPDQTMTVAIWKEGLEDFRQARRSIWDLKGKWVKVRSGISRYNGTAQIEINQAKQLELLIGEKKAVAMLGRKIFMRPENNHLKAGQKKNRQIKYAISPIPQTRTKNKQVFSRKGCVIPVLSALLGAILFQIMLSGHGWKYGAVIGLILGLRTVRK
ncbi:hypothetical protein [Arachidicoccus terrestris]|uniref:hypothetical protein n=1 Tax=Arachidicoccus terrestris TaxID=2875539 RepID=UPI001CC4B338|nr:hypothetical protein [Arachidicoccus terrestris]UAY55686.1 hypothetical protein K9M52_01240 [Arachidicoccus terrestris]